MHLLAVRGQWLCVGTQWWVYWGGESWAPVLQLKWNPSGRASAGRGSCTTSVWPALSPASLCCPASPGASGPAVGSAAWVPASTQTHNRTPGAMLQSRRPTPSGWWGQLVAPPQQILLQFHPCLHRHEHHLLAMRISFVCGLDFRGCHPDGRLHRGYCCGSGLPGVHPSDWHGASCCELCCNGHARNFHSQGSADRYFSCYWQIWCPAEDHGRPYRGGDSILCLFG